MRTRIAQDAARDEVASLRTTTKRPTRPLRRGAGAGLICAAVLAGAVLSPTTAVANHQFATKYRKRAVSLSLPPRLSLMPVAMDWLTPRKTARKAAHVAERVQAPMQMKPLSVPPPSPPLVLTDSNSTTTPDWACIRLYESGDRYNSPTAPGGAYGFLESTWLSLGYSGWPYQASPWVQSRAALFLHNELGWQPWSTRFVCGL